MLFRPEQRKPGRLAARAFSEFQRRGPGPIAKSNCRLCTPGRSARYHQVASTTAPSQARKSPRTSKSSAWMSTMRYTAEGDVRLADGRRSIHRQAPEWHQHCCPRQAGTGRWMSEQALGKKGIGVSEAEQGTDRPECATFASSISKTAAPPTWPMRFGHYMKSHGLRRRQGDSARGHADAASIKTEIAGPSRRAQEARDKPPTDGKKASIERGTIKTYGLGVRDLAKTSLISTGDEPVEPAETKKKATSQSPLTITAVGNKVIITGADPKAVALAYDLARMVTSVQRRDVSGLPPEQCERGRGGPRAQRVVQRDARAEPAAARPQSLPVLRRPIRPATPEGRDQAARSHRRRAIEQFAPGASEHARPHDDQEPTRHGYR